MVRGDEETLTAWLPDLLYTGGRFARGLALVCDGAGRITHLTRDYQQLAARVVSLPGRALLPGLVNAHSHSFQRVIRGRTEHRAAARDSFWTWRAHMYSAAARLTPEDLYDAARMAFLEMSLTGITAVGEFHYLHHAPDGQAYADPNLLAKEVVRAACDVGLRIALLRVAYTRSGFETPPNPQQARFIERDAQTFLKHTDELRRTLAREPPDAGTHGDARIETALKHAWVGVAPHSVRAVPLPYLREVSAYARTHALPTHMHVAEQPAEIADCQREHARTPIALLADEGLLDSRFTAVHAVHVTPEEIDALARGGAYVCACPTTERNLGDGIVPADLLFAAGVPLSLGTDSHTQIDPLEDARELEYHLRLQHLARNVLAPVAQADPADAADTTHFAALAARLFDCATINGAHSIAAPAGTISVGRAADFFAVDLNEPSIAGAHDAALLPAIVFSLARTAVRDVVVGGQTLVQNGQHRAQQEIIARFTKLQRKLWA